MKSAKILLLVLIALSATVRCASSRPDSAKDAESIRMQLRAWPSAAEAGDIQKYLTFVTDDVLMLPPNQAPLRGKREISEFLRGALAIATFDITVHPPEELVVTDGWAYARYRVQMVVHPKSGGASSELDRKYLDIWRREPDGTWKCHRHMWNDNPDTLPMS